MSDPYVASIKGSIFSINPDARVIDVTHDIRPQAIEQGVFALQYALPYLPPHSIHVIVVDPGVGTDRRALALVTPDHTFIAPDNGLLSAALPDDMRSRASGEPAPVELSNGFAAYELANDEFHRKPVSITFHGRDIFSPVAAHLSLGVQPKSLGPRVSQVVAISPFAGRLHDDGTLGGRVIYVDRYGNLITDIRAEQLPSKNAGIKIAERTIAGTSRTYAEASTLTAIIASTGFLAIAVPNGSAAEELGVDVGEAVTVSRA